MKQELNPQQIEYITVLNEAFLKSVSSIEVLTFFKKFLPLDEAIEMTKLLKPEDEFISSLSYFVRLVDLLKKLKDSLKNI